MSPHPLLHQARQALAEHGVWKHRVEPCRPAELSAARAALAGLVIEAQRLGCVLQVESDDEHLRVAVVTVPDVPAPERAEWPFAMGGNPGT